VTLVEEIAGLDEATLRPIVEKLVAVPVRDLEWTATPVDYKLANPVSAGLFRFAGTARAGATDRPWSAVLKVLQTISDEDAARFRIAADVRLHEAFRWDREACAYESGLFGDSSSGFRAARWLGSRRGAHRCWVWLEDLGRDDERWDVSRYALAARHLGRFNGEWLAGRPLPQEDWLSRGWLRTWLEIGLASHAHEVIDDDAVWSEPIVRAEVDGDLRGRLRGAWARRSELLEALDRVPLTLCHLDSFRGNLFSTTKPSGDAETVAVDWSYVGIGPLGTDLSQLVIASIFYHGDDHDVRRLESACLPSYLAGLRESGWRGSASDVHTGYALAGAVRFLFVLGVLRAAPSAEYRARAERWGGTPYETQLALNVKRTEHLLGLAEPFLRNGT